MNNLKRLILGHVEDLVVNFVFYDRKEDEELSGKMLEDAIRSGEVTIEEIVAQFEKKLRDEYADE